MNLLTYFFYQWPKICQYRIRNRGSLINWPPWSGTPRFRVRWTGSKINIYGSTTLESANKYSEKTYYKNTWSWYMVLCGKYFSSQKKWKGRTWTFKSEGKDEGPEEEWATCCCYTAFLVGSAWAGRFRFLHHVRRALLLGPAHPIFFLEVSVADQRLFGTDPNPWIRISDKRIRLRILLFSSVTFKIATKKNFQSSLFMTFWGYIYIPYFIF